MYDQAFFDAGLYRMGTRSLKWDLCRAEHGADTLPMWVADMDFMSPTEVTEALLRRAAHPAYGYTVTMPDDTQALLDFWKRRHGLEMQAEDVTALPCVVTGLKAAIRALTAPGDGVIIQSPVYGPFHQSVEVTRRTLMDAPLQRDAAGRYHMDLAAVERCCQAGARLMLLCSPHNPVSRVWAEWELYALLEVLNRYRVPLVSDEIHADFVYAPNVFVPLLSLQRENALSLCAASKTFNLAGLQQASCLCADRRLRLAFQAEIEASGVMSGNLFALEATRAAYQHGDAWLDGLLAYLDGNRLTLAACLREALPSAILTPIDATYLAWIDLNAYRLSTEALTRRCEAAKVAFTGGTFFGEDSGEGFIRFNFGCPRAQIPEAVRRLRMAVLG
ncbi:MAG: PatB family C-S lyase [Clostridia bacterium]|nr:PatB family C-S lyase [Clostridia bacterium]